MKYLRNLNISIIVLSFLLTVFLHSCSTKTNIIFEDDFESYTDKTALENTWNTSGKGTITIDKTKAFSGTQSIKFNTGEGFSNHAFINLKSIFPVVENSFGGSFKMYVNEASKNGIHWTFLQASGTIKDTDYTAEVRYGGQHHKQFMANYDTKGIKTDCWQHSNIKIPEQEWFTIKWHFNGTNNTMKLWLNNTLIEKITVIDFGEGCLKDELENKWVFPVFDTLSLGWADYQKGSGQRTVWVDDIVIFN